MSHSKTHQGGSKANTILDTHLWKREKRQPQDQTHHRPQTAQQLPPSKKAQGRNLAKCTSDTKLRWGVTLDLKSYYHHLGLHPDIQRWMRICIQDTAYEMESRDWSSDVCSSDLNDSCLQVLANSCHQRLFVVILSDCPWPRYCMQRCVDSFSQHL